MCATDNSELLFAGFRLDTAQKRLFKGNEPIALPPKALDLLELLVTARGQLVTKSQILDAVWAGVVVEEASIAKTVFLLRQTLGDDDRGRSLIETVSKRGYRLAGEVATAESTKPTNAIAVLPFADLSPQRDHAHIAEGVADEVITALGRGKDIRVVARTSSFALSAANLDVREIGSRLSARAIIEGSVRTSGGSIRATARLIDCRTGTQLWADAFENSESGLTRVAESIAAGAAAALGVTIEIKAIAAPLENPKRSRAQDLYLQGRYLWNRRPGVVIEQAIRLFEQATQLDDRFALAWAGLADAHATLGSWESGALPHGAAQLKAREYAARALSLQPELPEAVTTLAYTALHYDWNAESATAGFQSALRRNASYGPAQHWLSHSLIAAGRCEESLQASHRALELDPFNPLMRVHLAWHHFMARQPGDTLDQSQQVMRADPGYPWAHCFASWGMEALGDTRGAVTAARDAVRLSNSDSVMLATLARALASDGEHGEARSLCAQLHGREANRGLFSYELALVHLAMAERERALEMLELAVAQRSGWIAYRKIDPRLDPLRQEPRFTALLASADA
jgi:TolB-like protein/Tfp pilus assembly protein PilF